MELNSQKLVTVDSVKLYNTFWNQWKLLGISWDSHKYLEKFCSLFVIVIVSISYPLHLTIELFLSKSFVEINGNLAINVTCIALFLKHYCLRYEKQNIRELLSKVSELDQRVRKNPDEVEYFNRVVKVGVQRIAKVIFYLFQAILISSFISAMLGKERRLLFPGWMPFDWRNSTRNYCIAVTYQFLCALFLIFFNTTNDIYPSMTLCLVSGHIRLLKMRVAKIGQDEKSTDEENNAELELCINDHKTLIDIIHLLQGNLYYTQFFQFLSSGLNICATVVYIVIFVNDLYLGIYYAIYLTSMIIELFLWCYYGSLLLVELETLPYSLLECNWIVQNRRFRRHLITFIELTLKKIKLKAGFFNMDLDAFVSTMKMCYSLYTILTKTKH